jgi:hypothetical protein
MIEAVRGHLAASSRPELNRISGSDVTSSQTTITLEFAMGGVARGAVLTVDLEQLLVWSVAGQVATVQRAYAGTTAATHASGALVHVNDRAPANVILRELNNEIRSYSSPAHGLFKVASVDLVYNATRSGYDLTGVTDLIDVLAVEASDVLAGDRMRLERYRVIRNQSTVDFPSGFVLYLYEAVTNGKAIRVSYKAAFTALAAVADDVLATSGLPESAHDIPPLGAAARLLAGRESRRNQTDAAPEPRQAADVPPGANTGSSRALLGLRNLRLREESARLHAMFPPYAKRTA